jgi:hypothetical protein
MVGLLLNIRSMGAKEKSMPDQYRKIVEARDTDTLSLVAEVSDSIFCLEYDFYTLLIDYERAVADGAVTWNVEFSLDGTDWYQSSVYDAGAVAVNSDTTSNVQREEFTYGGTAAAQEFFPFGPIEIDQFAKYMRFSVWESGGEQGEEGDCGVKVVLTRRKQMTKN